MKARDLVRSAGGVMPVRSLLDAGISRYVVSQAIRNAELQRVRRGWVALPDADPMLIAAARAGVVLTCVTQAQRLGLWAFDVPETHVAAPPHAGHVSVDAHVHWERPALPRDPNSLVDPIGNVLVIVARCQPKEATLVIWNSALQNNLIDLPTLRRLPLPERARSLWRECTPYADSGLETVVVPRLRWLRLPMRRQIWIAGHRVDLLIGDRLVVQIDGGHHVGRQRTEDIVHDARLMLMGYHVIRIGYDQVINRWHEVQEQITHAVAQGLHLAA